MVEQPHKTAHRIATEAAKQLVSQCVDAGLGWADMLIACETTVTVVVMAAIEMQGAASQGAKLRASTELMNVMTERAHGRISAAVLGKRFDG